MRVTANLISVEDEQEHQDYIFSNTVGTNISFIINLPSTGFFKLQIYGVAMADKRQELPGIYNYLINCRQITQAVFPFPKQYAQWKEGCFMAEPGVIPTPRGPFGSQVQKERLPEKVNFRVAIPGAEAVAVVANQEWTHLERLDNQEWTGPVKVNHCYGTGAKVTLNANFGGDKTSYATLLEYVL